MSTKQSPGQKRSAGPSRGQPSLEVAVCALRRIRDEVAYEPCHYEVCIVREGVGARCALPTGQLEPGAHPERLAKHELKIQTQLQAVRLIPLHIQAEPYRGEHSITAFFLAPVARGDSVHGYPSVATSFANLQFILDNDDDEFDMVYGHRDMILAVSSWLRDQHRLDETCSQLDIMFGQNTKALRQNLAGHPRFVMEENPLFVNGIRPEEDKLILGFNNPLFVSSRGQ